MSLTLVLTFFFLFFFSSPFLGSLSYQTSIFSLLQLGLFVPVISKCFRFTCFFLPYSNLYKSLCCFRNDTNFSPLVIRSCTYYASNGLGAVQCELMVRAIKIQQAFIERSTDQRLLLLLIVTKAKRQGFLFSFYRRSLERQVIQLTSVRTEILIQAQPTPKCIFFILGYYLDAWTNW